MKKIFLFTVTLILSIFLIVSCNKNTINNDAIENRTLLKEEKNRKPIFDIHLTVYKGKRSTNDTTTADPCDGRSICIFVGGDKAVISGGVMPYSSDEIPNNERYNFHLISNNTNGYTFRVYHSEILPEVYNKIFEGDKFIVDENYSFPDFVINQLGIDELVLHQGEYNIFATSSYTEFNF